MCRNLSILLPLITLFIIAGMSCQNQGQDPLANYYMPSEAINGGIVHQFESEGLQQGKEYWYYNLQENEDSSQLIITVYDKNLNQQQLSVEKPLANGWTQKQLMLFFADTSGVRSEKATIHTGNKFAFDLQDSLDVLHYSLEWTEMLDQQEVTKRLFRNSRFMGFDTVELMGEPHRAAHFLTRDKIEDDREGTLTLDLKSDEFYVKNWGLVEKRQFYLKNGKEIIMRHMKLTDTMRMTDLEQLLKDKN